MGVIDALGALFKFLLPLMQWLFKYVQANDELKQSFFKFIEAYNAQHSAVSAVKESADQQDAELKKIIEAENEKLPK